MAAWIQGENELIDLLGRLLEHFIQIDVELRRDSKNGDQVSALFFAKLRMLAETFLLILNLFLVNPTQFTPSALIKRQLCGHLLLLSIAVCTI